jgi:hypothetical protein
MSPKTPPAATDTRAPLTATGGTTRVVTCDIADTLLQCRSDRSDRYVFSKYYLPARLQVANNVPLLTRAQKAAVRRYLSTVPAARAAIDSNRELRATLERNGIARDAVTPGDAVAAAGGPSSPPATTTTTSNPIEDLLLLLQSQVGYLFLDRTRISPSGFAIGEHLYTLSLAPGEEVVLEQKTFSKREVTFEEQTEEETQKDLELSSTLSTELQEGAEFQRSRTNSAGFTVGGTVGGDIKGVEVSANLGFSTNVTEASNETRKRSIKENTTSTQRVAARYRAAHKVSFSVAAQTGFEASSRRVVRNPNRFTPINLHYFKVMQVLELTQQRYGVRLCWAPSVKDPGFDLFDRIRIGREAILQKAEQITLPP